MKEFYLIAIDNKNLDALNRLARYCYNESDHKNAAKYFTMLIDNGIEIPFNDLGCCYFYLNDAVNLKKYFLMAIQNGNTQAAYNLGYYYSTVNDDENMVKYLLIAIEGPNKGALDFLIRHYKSREDHDNYLKYLQKGLQWDPSNNNYKDQINENLKKCKNQDTLFKYASYLNKSNLNRLNTFILNFTDFGEKHDINKQECFICYEEKYVAIYECGCKYKICVECFLKINKCPICRKNFDE